MKFLKLTTLILFIFSTAQATVLTTEERKSLLADFSAKNINGEMIEYIEATKKGEPGTMIVRFTDGQKIWNCSATMREGFSKIRYTACELMN